MLEFLSERYWCVEEGAAWAWVEGVAGVVSLGELGGVGGVQAAVLAARERGPMRYALRGGDAVIPVRGMLLGSRNWLLDYFGITYSVYGEISAEVGAAAGNGEVKRIVLEVDSPGGMAQGCAACAAAIYAARGVKPVVARVGALGASAAYYLASQATRVECGADSLVGSIGCVIVRDDWSARFEQEGVKRHVVGSGPHKGAFTQGSKIFEEHLASEKELVMGLAQQFWDAVARGRGRKVEGTRAVSGEVFLGDTARGLGLVDVVGVAASVTDEGDVEMIEGTVEVAAVAQPVVAPAVVQPVTAAVVAAVEPVLAPQAAAVAPVVAAAPVRVAASVSELRAAFASDPGYALDAAERGLTLAEVREEYARMTAFAAQRLAGVGAPVGAPALEQGVGGSAGGGGGDARAMARALAKEKGVSFLAALQEVYRENPALHAAAMARGKRD